MSVLLIALLVAVGAYVLFVIAFPKAVPEDKNANIRNALDRLYEENRANENSSEAIFRDQLNEQDPMVRSLFSLPFMKPLYEAGVQAGYQNNLKQLLLIMIMGFTFGILLTVLLGLGLKGLPIALVLGYLLPLHQCKRKLKARNKKFIDQFPDALDMLVRSVRGGFPLSTALQMLAENAEDPVKEEFRKVNDDIALGRTLGQALGRLAVRINEPDVRFFVVVLAVQQETGGNLSEIIGNLSGVIRKRKQLRHKIKALTSEGKATGLILGGLPVFIFVLLYFVQPGYLQPFFHDPTGQMLLGVVGGLLGVCFLIVKAMINIDI